MHRYAQNRSLWFDELTVALRLRHASFLDLLRPFDVVTEVYRVDRDVAPAPVGFLLLVRACTSLFGDSEWALRLVPLLAGLAALGLFARWLGGLPDRRAGRIALALFALSPLQTVLGAELKPYTGDVLIAVALLAGYDAALRGASGRAAALRLGAAGAAALWFSFPAVFPVAGGGLVLLWQEARLRRSPGRRMAWALACLAALPAASFALHWRLQLGELRSSAFLAEFWAQDFPRWPWSADGAAFWGRLVHAISLLWGPLPLAWLSLAVASVGAFRLGRSDRLRLALLALPLCATLAAAVLRLYPMQERLLLFWDPALALFLGAGFSFLIGGLAQISRALAWIVLAGVLANPILMHLTLLREPSYGYRTQEVREILEIVARERRPEDQLYVYYGASHAFGYYAARFGLDRADAVHEPWRPGPRLGRRLRRLDPARPVWAIFSQAYEPEQKKVLELLGARRPLRERREAVRAAAFLFGPEAPAASGH